MLRIKTTLLAAIVLTSFNTQAKAQFGIKLNLPKPIKNTPLDPGTYKVKNLIKKSNDDSGFHHVPTSPSYSISARGRYEGWLFQGNQRVRRAKLGYKGNKAYYYDSKTRVSVRAPHRDRGTQLGNSVAGVPTSSTSGRIQHDPTTRRSVQINPSNGQVYRVTKVGNRIQSTQYIGRATKSYQNGRAVYRYGKLVVWAR